MAFTSLTEEETAAGAPGSEPLFRKILDNFDALNGQIGSLASIDIPNGSFEIDSDSDGQPDSWTRSMYPGGTGGKNVAPAEGAACLQIAHPGGAGNGGGYYDSDYILCSGELTERIGLLHWASAAGMRNKVEVRFFDSGKIYIGMAVLYDSTSNPTSKTQLDLAFKPLLNTRFYKLRLTGGYTDTDVAGTAYFDAVTRAPNIRYYTGGDYLVGGVHGEFSTESASFVKAFEFVMQSSGTIDISFVAGITGGYFLTAEAYIDGVGTGNTMATQTYGIKTIDNVTVERGEKLQIYVKVTGNTGTITNPVLLSTSPGPVCAGAVATAL